MSEEDTESRIELEKNEGTERHRADSSHRSIGTFDHSIGRPVETEFKSVISTQLQEGLLLKSLLAIWKTSITKNSKKVCFTCKKITLNKQNEKSPVMLK